MAFITEKHLEGSKYVYQLAPTVKKFTLKEINMTANTYKLVPNSNEGFLLKIIVNPDLSGFKLSVTDKSGLRNVDIFKNASEMIQNKFYFQMDALVDRGVFTKSEI